MSGCWGGGARFGRRGGFNGLRTRLWAWEAAPRRCPRPPGHLPARHGLHRQPRPASGSPRHLQRPSARPPPLRPPPAPPPRPSPLQRTPDQQPVQLRATMGSSGRSRAVTTNVGAGQNAPPSPTMPHSWRVSASRSMEELRAEGECHLFGVCVRARTRACLRACVHFRRVQRRAQPESRRLGLECGLSGPRLPLRGLPSPPLLTQLRAPRCGSPEEQAALEAGGEDVSSVVPALADHERAQLRASGCRVGDAAWMQPPKGAGGSLAQTACVSGLRL